MITFCVAVVAAILFPKAFKAILLLACGAIFLGLGSLI